MPENYDDYADIFGVDVKKKPQPTQAVASQPAAPAQNFDDYADIFGVKPERTVLNTISDTGVSLAKGVVGLGQAATGLANLSTGGMFGKALDKTGYDANQSQQFLSELYSPAQQEANKKVEEAKGFVDTGKALITNPSTLFHQTVETVPSMLGGGAIARKGLEVAGKVAPRLMAKAGAVKWGGTVAGAAGEGFVGGGQQAEQIRQDDPDKTLSLKQAGLSAASGVGTAAFGLAGGSLAKKLGFTDFDTFLATGTTGTAKKEGFKGILKKIVGGGISEGAFEEMPQSAQEQILYNAAVDKPLMDGVSEAAASGLVLGGVMGSGANLLPSAPSGPIGKALSSIQPQTIGEGALSETAHQETSAFSPVQPEITPAVSTVPSPTETDIRNAGVISPNETVPVAPPTSSSGLSPLAGEEIGTVSPSFNENDIGQREIYADIFEGQQGAEDIGAARTRKQNFEKIPATQQEEKARAYNQYQNTKDQRRTFFGEEANNQKPKVDESPYVRPTSRQERKAKAEIEKYFPDESPKSENQSYGDRLLEILANKQEFEKNRRSTPQETAEVLKKSPVTQEEKQFNRQQEAKKFTGTEYADAVKEAESKVEKLSGPADAFSSRDPDFVTPKGKPFKTSASLIRVAKRQGKDLEKLKIVQVKDGFIGVPIQTPTEKPNANTQGSVERPGGEVRNEGSASIAGENVEQGPGNAEDTQQQTAMGRGSIDIGGPGKAQTPVISPSQEGREDGGDTLQQEPIGDNKERTTEQIERQITPTISKTEGKTDTSDIQKSDKTRDISSDKTATPNNTPAASTEPASAPMGVTSKSINKRDRFGDPASEESIKVQSGIEGKTINEVVKFIINNSPDRSHRLIAQKVGDTISRLQSAGMKFKFHVAHLGDEVPNKLIGARGVSVSIFGKENIVDVWINGSDVTGKVGTSSEVVLHELIHAATQAAIYTGNSKISLDEKLSKPINDLIYANNKIVEHFNRIVAESKNGGRELTDFEKRIYSGQANAIANPHEILAWAFTNKEMQDYLESISSGRTETLWSRFVKSVRSLLGLSERNDTMLSDVLKSGEEIFNAPTNSIMANLHTLFGNTAIQETVMQVSSARDVAKLSTTTNQSGTDLSSLKNKWKDKIDTIFISERDNGDINLSSLIIGKENRGSGTGTEFMKDLVSYADSKGSRIVLSPGQKDDRHGTTSRSRLVRFYKRFGFIENRGRNKDYTISEGMYRDPVKGKYSQGTGLGTDLSELTAEQRRVVDNLTDIGNVQIISHETALRKLARAGQDVSVFGPNAKPEGFFLSGKVHIIIENAKAGRLWGLFRHEVGVHVGKLLQSDTRFKALLKSIEDRRNDKSATGKAIRAAEKLVPANTGLRNGEVYEELSAERKAEVDAVRTEEILAYMVRDAKDIGVVRRVIATIKRILVELGIDPKIFTADDLTALADMAVRREAKQATVKESLQVGVNSFAQSAKMSIGRAKRVIQNMPAFKKWFSDSKVVDENGEPLVVYHGTGSKFTQFNDNRFNWFTTSMADAEDYNPEIIMPVFLKIENPADLDNSDVAELLSSKGFDVDDLYELTENAEEVRKVLEAAGYDGMMVARDDFEEGTIHYAAFRPNQTKSISNISWDGANPDIMMSQSSPFSKVTDKLVNSASFRRWFGSSKIKSKDKPVILYHGTPNKQFLSDPDYGWTFDTTRPIKADSSPFAGLGIFMGNETIATGHAGPEGTVHPFFVRVENPLIVTSEELEKKVTDLASAKAFKKRAQELGGHDGIIIKDRGQVIVFDPNQLKSADVNTGEFSLSNNDVRYSMNSINPFTGSIPRALSIAHEIAKKYDISARAERILTYLGDQDAAISRVQKEIGPQPERFDYNLIRRLTGKKIADELKTFTKERRNPLLQEIADAKLNIEDVDQLGWAQHAPERNLQMKRVNARQYIDTFLSRMTDTERTEYDERLGLIQDDVVMNDRTRNERRDQYVSLMDELSSEVINTEQEQRDAIEEEQKTLDEREFTQEEEDKGTKEFIQKRIDNATKRLDERLRIANKWEDVKDRLSGMTDEESQKIIDTWKKDKRFNSLQTIVDKMRKIGSDSLDMFYSSGELTKEEYEAIKNTYKFHVPLFREGAEEGKTSSGKQGIGPLASPIKIASGSTKGVTNVLGHVMDRYQAAVMRKHKLEAGKVLYDMVTNNPDDERWSIGQLDKKPYQDNEGNIRFYPEQQLDNKTETYVKVDGVKHIISVSKDNPAMVRWMEALNREVTPLGPLLKGSQKINQTLARLNTSFSPEFLLGNFMRDIQTAMINMNDSEAKGLQKTVLGGIKNAIKGIYQEESGKPSGEWGKVYREFSKNGGKIGWMQSYDDVQSLADDLEKELSYMKGERPLRQKIRKTVEWIEKANSSVENGVRLSTYKALVDSGKVSPRKAAHIVSNLTVDFTRHGTAGPTINSMYMFANAAIQSNIRVLKAITRSKTIQKITGGIIGFGFAASMLGAYGGGDDDDGENYYDKLKRTNPYIFERNMVFMIPGTKGKYIKIPMPYEYSPFFVLGNELASVLRPGEGNTITEAGARFLTSFLNAMNPLSSNTILQTLAPTVADPIVMIAENKDFAGRPLMPERNPFGIEKPDSERYFKSVNPYTKVATNFVNRLTGGSAVKSGAIDVSPETIDMLIGQFTGSLGKVVKDTLSIPVLLTKDGEIESYKVPFVRRFYGGKSTQQDQSIYIQNKKEIDQFIADYKNALPEERPSLQGKKEFQLMAITKSTESRLKRLRQRENFLLKKGEDDQAKLVRERMNEVMNRYNTRYNGVIM